MNASNCGVGKSAEIWRCSATFVFCILLFFATDREAKAGFVGAYDFVNFRLTNSVLANGYVEFPDSNTLVLFGPNDGSGAPGTTDFTIAALADGICQFDYMYSAVDDPGWDFAGYLESGDFNQFADSSGQAGTIVMTLSVGELMGFRVGTLDNIGEPGVLTITNFSGPAGASQGQAVPEPTGASLFLLAAALGIVRQLLRNRTLRLRLCAAAMLLAGVTPLSAQQYYYNGSNVTGQLHFLTSVNLMQQPQFAGLRLMRVGSIFPEWPKFVTQPLRPAMGATALSSPQTLAAAKALAILPSSGLTGFNALSHLDQRNANFGNQFSVEPPNQSIAVANGYILEGVNDAIRVYDTSGRSLITLAANQLFGLPPAIDRSTGVNGVYLTDMRVFYDQGINRWFVVQRSQDNDIYGNPLNRSHLYLAISQTGDPTATYNIYVMDTTSSTHPGCPCIADYPQIGSDQYGFHIAWNNFSTAYGVQFVDAAILAVSKASLATGGQGAPDPTAMQFFIPNNTGYEFSIQPATTPPGASNFLANGGLEYFASTVSSSYGDHLTLWAMYNTSSLATSNPNPTLTRTTIPTLSYRYPGFATQPPGPLPLGSSLSPPAAVPYLDGGDLRVLSLSYASGRLFLTVQTGLNDEVGRWVVGAAYVVLSPTFRNGTLAATTLNQGYLMVNNNHLLRPAIAVNAQGRGAIAATLVGPDWYPSAALIPFDTFSTPTGLQVGAQGTAPEDGFSAYSIGGGWGVARWGDYNTAVAAGDGSIWMVAQYIGNYARTDFANWNTYIMHKQP